jgi:hypothetical protein
MRLTMSSSEIIVDQIKHVEDKAIKPRDIFFIFNYNTILRAHV